MTHLPYILSAYGITVLTLSGLWFISYKRFNQAKKKLDVLKKHNYEA